MRQGTGRLRKFVTVSMENFGNLPAKPRPTCGIHLWV
jgi:hypothetical protein